jgi:hypothetical protein
MFLILHFRPSLWPKVIWKIVNTLLLMYVAYGIYILSHCATFLVGRNTTVKNSESFLSLCFRQQVTWEFPPKRLSVSIYVAVNQLTVATIQVITQTRCMLKLWIPYPILKKMKTTLSSAWWLCIERWANSSVPACNIASTDFRYVWFLVSKIQLLE